MSSSSSSGRWEALLAWLAARGADIGSFRVECRPSAGAGNGLYALQPSDPSTLLFTIPASALVNIKTLAPFYPTRRKKHSLNATQLISLHFALHRPTPGGQSNDPVFGPYIDVLPRDFASHPLTWLLAPEADATKTLYDVLPPAVKTALAVLRGRFEADWRHATKYWKTLSSTVQGPAPNLADFLWAWLNVNTRCIFHRLKPALDDPDNLTLVPVLDFANHRPAPHAYPRGNNSPLRLAPSPKANNDFVLLAPTEGGLRPGDEVYLQYGAHANRTLFVEYGFVNTPGQEGAEEEADVGDLVEDMIQARGMIGETMQRVLKEEGYWGDWTMHASPARAHPSFRLITALRLYVLSSSDSDTLDGLDDWRATLRGLRPCVSRANESAWRGVLGELCVHVVNRAVEGERAVDGVQGNEQWMGWMKENVKELWREDQRVAQAVIESLRLGVEF